MGIDNKEIFLLSIEDAILASFLFLFDEGMEDDGLFLLDESIFSSRYKQRIASKINEEIQNGDHYFSMLNVMIEEKTLGTAYEQEWLYILSQTAMPMTLVKKYYDLLALRRKQNIARSLHA